jgi:hypothetical protein
LPQRRKKFRFSAAHFCRPRPRIRAARFDTLDAVMRLLICLFLAVPPMWAQPGQKWVASWAASVQGPYPVGNGSAQPNLSFAFPAAGTSARDQTFRLIVQPDLRSISCRSAAMNRLE